MTTIITKNGSGAPTAGQLSEGELAVDLTNKELYTKSGSTVIKIGAQGGSSGTFTNLTATSSFTSPGIDDNANATAITIDANENVGIGTTSPASYNSAGDNLVVAGSGNAGMSIVSGSSSTGTVYFADGTSGSETYRGFIEYNHTDDKFKIGTAGNGRVYVDASGNVGIGTTSPSTYDSRTNNLVVGDSGDAGITVFSGASNTARLQFAPSGDTGLNNGLIGYNNATDKMSFATAGSDRVTIASSGSVGIGTSAPTDKLDVKASTANERLVRISHPSSPTAAAGYFGFVNSGSGDNTGVTLGVQYADDYYNAITVDRETQNVGIGTDTPAALLAVNGSSAGELKGLILRNENSAASGQSVSLTFETSSGTSGGTGAQAARIEALRTGFGTTGDLLFHTSNAGQSYERLRLDSSGNLLVGKTSANASLAGAELRSNGQINSTINGDTYQFYNPTAGVYRFYVSSAGVIHATSTSITGISDASLKENVRDLDSGLDTIKALRPRRFDWKNGDGADVMGFIAQEVEEVMPELVEDHQYTAEEVKKGLRMGDMIPAMVKAMQEQQAMIETLQAEVAALKGA